MSRGKTYISNRIYEAKTFSDKNIVYWSSENKIPVKLNSDQEEYLKTLLKQIHIFGIASMVYGHQVHL